MRTQTVCTEGIDQQSPRTNLGFRLTVAFGVARANVCSLRKGTEDSFRKALCCDHLIAVVAQRLGPIDSGFADTVDGISDSLSFKGCLGAGGP